MANGTLNLWYFVAPFLCIVTALFALAPHYVGADGRMKLLFKDEHVWLHIVCAYSAITSIIVGGLMVYESFWGAVELLGRDREGVEFVTMCGIFLLSVIYGYLQMWIFILVASGHRNRLERKIRRMRREAKRRDELLRESVPVDLWAEADADDQAAVDMWTAEVDEDLEAGYVFLQVIAENSADDRALEGYYDGEVPVDELQWSGVD